MPLRGSRPSLGRRRIPMERIERPAARQVAFSKRRDGLFKKASELSVLCGPELAAVVFSPGDNKAFSFGSPSVDAVLLATLFANNNNNNAGSSSSSAPAAALTEAGSSSSPAPAAVAAELLGLTKEYEELRAMLEREKLRKGRAEEEMRRQREAAAGGCPAVAWLDAGLAGLSEADLVELKAALMEVKSAIDVPLAMAPAAPVAMPMMLRGFASSVCEAGGSSSSSGNKDGAAGPPAMEEMMQQLDLDLVGQIVPAVDPEA